MKKLVGLIILGIILIAMASGKDNSPSSPSSPPLSIEQQNATKQAEAQKKAEEDARCRADRSCWGNKNVYLGYLCRQSIEGMAKYDFKWTDGWLESKFSHFRWKNWDKQILSVSGDKIQLQNGFGGFIRHTYECDINLSNPDSPRAIDVRLVAGKLN